MNARQRFLHACERMPVDRPPLWLLGQAGPYLPEFRELAREYDPLHMARDPHLITQVSLMPLKRFGLDAVAVFSDILLPAQAMGLHLTLDDDHSLRFDVCVDDTRRAAALRSPCVDDSLWYLFAATAELKETLAGETALIGSVGGPWTVAAYMIEGGCGDFTRARDCVRAREAFAVDLLARLTDVLAETAALQIRAGADAVQIYDTWAGLFEPTLYAEHLLPLTEAVIRAIHGAGGKAILSAHNARRTLEVMRGSPADVVAVASDTDIDEAFALVGSHAAVQGNLSPQLLLAPRHEAALHVRTLKERVGARPGWIANVGQALLPATPLENIAMFVDEMRAPPPL